MIYCAGSSASELAYQRAVITRTITTARAALLQGVLPGGGVALLRCSAALQARQAASADLHERAAYQILLKAAAAPCRALLANAGQEAPGLIVAEILRGQNGSGYDLRTGRIVDMNEAGLLDSAAALMAALRNGIGGAALALTIDTVVHRVRPPLAIEPGGLPANTDLGQIQLK